MVEVGLIVGGVAILIAIIALALGGYALTKSGKEGPKGPVGPPGPAGGSVAGPPGSPGSQQGQGTGCPATSIPTCDESLKLKKLSKTIDGIDIGSGDDDDDKIKFNSKTLIGIGIDNPKVPLHIANIRNPPDIKDSVGGGGVIYTIMSDVGAIGTTDNHQQNWSIITRGWVGAESFAANSDERIKKDIDDIPDSLEIIEHLYPKKYKFIEDNKYSYGLVAQDVKKVIPDAIKYKRDFIPNIYKKISFEGLGDKTIILDLSEYNIKVGDNIQLIEDGDKSIESKVIEIKDNKYILKLKEKINTTQSKIFVYGKEIDDYHVLDYNHLFTLNLDATKKLNDKIKELEQQIADLKK
jgi:hypothetical protein